MKEMAARMTDEDMYALRLLAYCFFEHGLNSDNRVLIDRNDLRQNGYNRKTEIRRLESTFLSLCVPVSEVIEGCYFNSAVFTDGFYTYFGGRSLNSRIDYFEVYISDIFLQAIRNTPALAALNQGDVTLFFDYLHDEYLVQMKLFKKG